MKIVNIIYIINKIEYKTHIIKKKNSHDHLNRHRKVSKLTKDKKILSDIRNDTRMFPLTFLLIISLKISSRVIWQESKIKDFLILKITIMSKFMYSLSIISTKIAPNIFAELVKLVLKFIEKYK